MDTIHFNGASKKFVKIVPERPQINYARIPVAALSQMGYFMKELEPRLSKVKVPALVVQANGDPVVNPEGTALLFNRLGTKRKKYVTFDFDRHGILAGPGSEGVHAEIGSFVNNILEES